MEVPALSYPMPKMLGGLGPFLVFLTTVPTRESSTWWQGTWRHISEGNTHLCYLDRKWEAKEESQQQQVGVRLERKGGVRDVLRLQARGPRGGKVRARQSGGFSERMTNSSDEPPPATPASGL